MAYREIYIVLIFSILRTQYMKHWWEKSMWHNYVDESSRTLIFVERHFDKNTLKAK